MKRFRRGVVVGLTVALSLTAVPSASAAAHGATATYEVRAGDSLGGIATKLNIRLSDLLTLNSLRSNSLILPGQTLKVPEHASPTPTAPAPLASGGSYTVRTGDSLYRIATKLGVRLTDLLSTNGLKLNSLILPGQQLSVPPGATVPPVQTPSTPPAAPGAATYVVRAGDSLSRIASRSGTTLGALLSANSMTASSLILPGMTLTLPAGATPPRAPADPPASEQPTTDGPSPTGSGIDTVLSFARAQEGKPYKFFTAGPDTFDCSGLTKAAFAQVGITLVHQSAAQARQGSAVAFLSDPIRPGDLVFLALRGDDVVSHVGMALGGGLWVHATRPGKPVTISSLPTTNKIFAVRRIVG
jgi:LysM repeat protein